MRNNGSFDFFISPERCIKIRSNTKIWQLIDVLKEATAYLKTKNIESARLNAEWLLSHVLSLPRLDLYLRYQQPLSQKERDQYKTLLRRRAFHEPLQYILGESEFMSLPFKVSPEVLIPRPETESLVERIIDAARNMVSPRILDIGVGSGIISISLAKYLQNAELIGVDIDDRILNLAHDNAERNEVKETVSFLNVDIRKPEFDQKVNGPFDIIVSNPPYISREEWENLPEEIREYEPRSALCDDNDGLTFYRIIAKNVNKILKTGGQLFLEIGAGQYESVQTILKSAGFQSIDVFPDLNEIKRVVVGCLN